jgi:hypothetical protein
MPHDAGLTQDHGRPNPGSPEDAQTGTSRCSSQIDPSKPKPRSDRLPHHHHGPPATAPPNHLVVAASCINTAGWLDRARADPSPWRPEGGHRRHHAQRALPGSAFGSGGGSGGARSGGGRSPAPGTPPHWGGGG